MSNYSLEQMKRGFKINYPFFDSGAVGYSLWNAGSQLLVTHKNGCQVAYDPNTRFATIIREPYILH